MSTDADRFHQMMDEAEESQDEALQAWVRYSLEDLSALYPELPWVDAAPEGQERSEEDEADDASAA